MRNRVIAGRGGGGEEASRGNQSITPEGARRGATARLGRNHAVAKREAAWRAPRNENLEKRRILR